MRTPSSARLAAAVAQRLRELRARHGWSLDALAKRSGVSKGMLVQIENAGVNPSLGTLVRIADALATNVARLVQLDDAPRLRIARAGEQPVLWSGKRGSSAILLGGSDRLAHMESWRWQIAPRDGYASRAHPQGTEEFLHVTHGTLTLLLDGERHPLRSGESAVFDADVDHAYRNEGARQAVRLIMFVITPDPPAGASRTVDRTPRATRAPRPRRTRGTGGGRQDEEE